MMLNDEQRIVVEENMGLIGKVIKDRGHGLGQPGFMSYEDLYQIGCLGLCKAAATDRGGCFSTYAYRIIWNEICDALIKTSRLNSKETLLEPEDNCGKIQISGDSRLELIELRCQLQNARDRAKGCTAKGITCLMLSLDGYSSKDLGRIYGTDAAAVRMWMTKARRFLKEQPELQQYAGDLK